MAHGAGKGASDLAPGRKQLERVSRSLAAMRRLIGALLTLTQDPPNSTGQMPRRHSSRPGFGSTTWSTSVSVSASLLYRSLPRPLLRAWDMSIFRPSSSPYRPMPSHTCAPWHLASSRIVSRCEVSWPRDHSLPAWWPSSSKVSSEEVFTLA